MMPSTEMMTLKYNNFVDKTMPSRGMMPQNTMMLLREAMPPAKMYPVMKIMLSKDKDAINGDQVVERQREDENGSELKIHKNRKDKCESR